MSKRRSCGGPCWPCVLIFSVLILASDVFHAVAQDSSYRVIRNIPLGGDGGWDYVTVDPEARRIYIPRSNHVMVLDEVTGKVIGDMGGMNGLHHVAIVPEFNKGFIAGNKSEDEGTIYVFDLKTLKITSAIKSNSIDTDSLIYDPGTKRVFVNNADGKSITVVTAQTEQVAGMIMLDGSPEAGVVDGKGSIFNNIADNGQIIEFDTKTLKIKNRWPTNPCEQPVGLAMDTAHRRLLLACRGKVNLLAVMNADSGKVVTTAPIGIGADGVVYDPATGIVFVTCRDSGNGKSGVTKVFHQDSPDKYPLVADVETIYGARTLALDPKTHHVFSIGTARNDPVPPTKQDPNPRPRPVLSTFQVLEIGR
jgi:DNA-binding beta-propeller fold protein YncE